MEELIIRNDEVVGSIPTSSTIFSITCGESDCGLRTKTYRFDSPLAFSTMSTMSTMRRREEFVRHFIARIGGKILGEDPADSEDRLRRLDYGTLLEEAERASSSAEDRLAYLKKLQQEQESKLGGRSKI
jgi:hypothetical protein